MGKIEDINRKAKTMTLLKVMGRNHVLIETETGRILCDNSSGDPDYMNTGLALAGVLKEGETLNSFKEKWIDGQLRINTLPLNGVESLESHRERWIKYKLLKQL